MSFNYLEIARAVELIREALPDKVLGAELAGLSFDAGGAGGAGVSDVNVALKLERARKAIVFSLKAPWVGVFFVKPGALAPAGKGRSTVWATAFNGCEGPARDWNAYIQGTTLDSIDQTPGDRVVTLRFSNGTELVVELIPARPNWVLRAGGQEFRWRAPMGPAARPRQPGVTGEGLVVRSFGAVGSDADASTSSDKWMTRAFEHYLELRRKLLLQTRIQRAGAQLQARAARVAKVRGQMRGSLAESAKAEELRVQAETLKGHLHELPPGRKAGVFNNVELDRRYTVAENVSRMFARYKKLVRTRKEVEARLVGIEEEAKALTDAVGRVRAFKGDLAEFTKLAASLGLETGEPSAPEGAKKPRKEDRKWAALAQKGVRRFQSAEGMALWIGRSHKENEELVVRLARGNDLWLHLKGRPGAHGVIQIPAGKSPSLETLLDAATLVAYYSGVKEKEKVEVDYTFRKYVKRVPGVGGEKFLVTYSQNKTLMLKVEEARLWRLLKQN